MLSLCRSFIAPRISPLLASIAGLPNAVDAVHADGALVFAGGELGKGADSQLTVSEELAASIPSVVLVGQAGVPKRKKSVYYRTRKTMGVHFKHKNLRYQPWYYCPLCAEPKQQGTCCRREDCREMKP